VAWSARVGVDKARQASSPPFSSSLLISPTASVTELRLLVLIILLFATPANSERFWWTAAALGFLVLVHATYWVVTHPVNLAWLKHTKISGISASFFGLFSAAEDDWRQMRNIWESSHLARACFATLSFLSMTLALIR
jgi:hypothetical protein